MRRNVALVTLKHHPIFSGVLEKSDCSVGEDQCEQNSAPNSAVNSASNTINRSTLII